MIKKEKDENQKIIDKYKIMKEELECFQKQFNNLYLIIEL